MNKLKSVQPARVGVQFTTHCDFTCAHCLVNCGPYGGRSMSAETIIACAEAAREAGASNFVFTGGEPFLHKELLLTCIKHVHGLGLKVQVLTNAGWARDPGRRDRIVDELAMAGLSSLAISYDLFHQPFGDQASIRVLIHKLKKCGIEPLIITVLSSYPSNIEILRFVAALDTPVLIGLLNQMGRAKNLPQNYYMSSPRQVGICKQANAPMVLVDGKVMFCCGFADLAAEGASVPTSAIMGNVHNQEIVSIFRDSALPIRAAFTNYSIDTLFAISGAVEQGARIEDFHSACDICRFLLSNNGFVERLTALGKGQISPDSINTRPSDNMTSGHWQSMFGKQVGISAQAELIQDVRIHGWLGRMGGAEGLFDILCLPDAQGNLEYHLLGKAMRTALLPLMSGKTCLLENPSDIREGNVDKRVEESVYRWMLLRLADLHILHPVTG